ncbi:Uncharacterised protein [Anaerococcus prevotii]|uniref:Uncharacterized protein n=1 Tax=Anaerococcus prevotii (strain ATCC 9321 / DSM 20548 / JCM 6508 / NCTC 11806 / PC1) TaxID=525919 RepID=C7RDS4_ANAPD|nr:hypothetical protein [Anaerococcus prevotii]ACV29337.1 hypothetical protein Apre_1314 [Anaerococcus prevotii DSM 20548]SUU95011.1 Uncharacterised protein [Anaerococcus prevotii]
MKVYIINSQIDKDRVKFAVSLAERLKKTGKTLLVSTKRNESNIEDYYGKDGMITYDLADYLKGVNDFKEVRVREDENLDFLIAPLLEDKKEIDKEDMDKILKEEGYKNLVIDSLDIKLVDEKKSVFIVEAGKFPEKIAEDSFFINGTSPDTDIRLSKEKIESYGKNYLGNVNLGQGFDKQIDNFINDNYVIVPDLTFFEKLKMKFKK